MSVKVCIVGAGPVGVVAAIACATRGMQVTLFEAGHEIDHSPRAATTHPSTLEMLAELGLLDEFQSVGLIARTFQFWDGATKTLVAEFDHEALRDETPYPYVVQTEQHKLVAIGLRRLAAMPNVCVRMATSLTDITQDAGGVRVTVEGIGGTEQHAFDYVVGCDGGRSTVRKMRGCRFRGLHLAGALPGADDAVRLPGGARLLLRAATSPIPKPGPISSRSWATT